MIVDTIDVNHSITFVRLTIIDINHSITFGRLTPPLIEDSQSGRAFLTAMRLDLKDIANLSFS